VKKYLCFFCLPKLSAACTQVDSREYPLQLDASQLELRLRQLPVHLGSAASARSPWTGGVPLHAPGLGEFGGHVELALYLEKRVGQRAVSSAQSMTPILLLPKSFTPLSPHDGAARQSVDEEVEQAMRQHSTLRRATANVKGVRAGNASVVLLRVGTEVANGASHPAHQHTKDADDREWNAALNGVVLDAPCSRKRTSPTGLGFLCFSVLLARSALPLALASRANPDMQSPGDCGVKIFSCRDPSLVLVHVVQELLPLHSPMCAATPRAYRQT
jgi:hypothetical protein